MLTLAILFTLVCAAPTLGFESCDDCLDTIPLIGSWIHEGAGNISEYLEEHYCPHTHDEDCAMHVNEMYPTMLEMIAEEFIVLSAHRICEHVFACGQEVKNQIVKDMSCLECTVVLEDVHDMLTGKDHVTEMEHLHVQSLLSRKGTT
ncbi:uncharacterized protein LOC111712273 isoform X2 [Eurytemora carolleeae]|uniref:uncharacterized protein LOC111712273 isoform X2 n=1 Tax=Eurytemora carolleeae TaxID=1294199 RepID=UPI000C791182|nr:uncharacterized protein LOC111712273 isoform X2 [Eurytemora carolleeae]|eukprot:XP_023342612.1 uncharacterized protein LOC111712273 isoform X2 [Eurytemora affinis]